MEYAIIFGGSFNPPHIGHLRSAIELLETFPDSVLHFLPSGNPPHKDGRGLLGLDLRAAMLEACIKGMPPHLAGRSRVCSFEEHMQGPSYTHDVLKGIADTLKGYKLCFALGQEDFSRMHAWRKAELIPKLAHIAVMARGYHGPDAFIESVNLLCPGAAPCNKNLPDSCRGVAYAPLVLDGLEGERFFYLDFPEIPISSSQVRQKWHNGKSISFLVPGAVKALLADNREAASAHWNLDASAKPVKDIIMPGDPDPQA